MFSLLQKRKADESAEDRQSQLSYVEKWKRRTLAEPMDSSSLGEEFRGPSCSSWSSNVQGQQHRALPKGTTVKQRGRNVSDADLYADLARTLEDEVPPPSSLPSLALGTGALQNFEKWEKTVGDQVRFK